MTYDEKKSLYESIMKEVAKDVKRRINELSLPTVHSYYRKNRKYGMSYDITDYEKCIDFNISEPLTIFNKMRWMITGSTDYSEESFDFILYLYKDNKKMVVVEGRMSRDAITDKFIDNYCFNDILGMLKHPDEFEEDINEYNFIRILTRHDAKALAKAINDETGLEQNWRNFYMDYTYDFPSELKNKSIIHI